jgi:hypothetical protein
MYVLREYLNSYKYKNSGTLHLTGRGGLYVCEMLTVTHCLGNRSTNGGKAVSLTHQLRTSH